MADLSFESLIEEALFSTGIDSGCLCYWKYEKIAG